MTASRKFALTMILLLAAELSAECISVTWTPRMFLSQAADVARGIGTAQYGVVISHVLVGKNVRAGELITIPPSGCCGAPEAGVEYFVRRSCFRSDCRWAFVEAERAKGFEDYIRDRHFVTRAALIEKVRAWRRSALATDQFAKWLATADTNDNDTEGESLAMAAVESVDEVLDFVTRADRCRPGDTAHLREVGAKVLLEQLAKLPREEKLSQYDAWLDAHPDADDNWDGDNLEKNINAALTRDVIWRAAESCVHGRSQS